MEERLAFAALSEEAMGAIFEGFAKAATPVTGVTTTTTTITGVDGNDITLYVSRPADVGYLQMREYLAATGVLVVGVEFRNSGGKLGPTRSRRA